MADCPIAIVTDNLSYDSSYQAFERPPDTSTLYSAVPRGIRRFFFADDTSAKPINDTHNIFLTATLPVNFAYSLRSINLKISGDTISDLDNEADLRMFNHIPGQQVGTAEHMMLVMGLLNPATGDPFKCLRGDSYNLSTFATPFWSVHGGSVTMRLHLANVAAAAAAAGFLISHAEFYEYDLTQAQRYYINTPLPVLAR